MPAGSTPRGGYEMVKTDPSDDPETPTTENTSMAPSDSTMVTGIGCGSSERRTCGGGVYGGVKGVCVIEVLAG